MLEDMTGFIMFISKHIYNHIKTTRIMENSGIKKEFGRITVDSVQPDQYKEGMLSVQIRQEVTKIYPAKQISNSMSDALFSTEDFGFEGGKRYTENRVTWIAAPEGTTAEEVQAMLDNLPNARIYKAIGLEPILTEGQEYAIENGLTSLEEIAEKQLVRDTEGNPLLHNNEHFQYSVKFFSKEGKEDIDTRPAAVKVEADAKPSDLAS